MQARLARFQAQRHQSAFRQAGPETLETIILSHRCGPTIIVQSNRKMPKQKSTGFNPKKEVSVMAWIENDQGSALLVRQAAGQRLGRCRGNVS